MSVVTDCDYCGCIALCVEDSAGGTCCHSCEDNPTEEQSVFYIAFDGFDLFKLHFATREAAQKHLDDNYMKLARHCQYQVAVYEK